MKSKLFILFLLGIHVAYGQKNPKKAQSPFTLYKDKIVLYTDLGFSTSPYTIRFKSAATDVTKLKFKNNLGLVMGFGGSYKWFALRLSFALTKNLRTIGNWGKTSYFDVGFDFPIKKMYFEFDFRNYKGYAIKNAYHWDDSLNPGQKNEIRPDAASLTVGLSGWYFHNKEFKMNSLKGKVGHYDRQVFTWYLKSTINIQGVSDVGSIIPYELTDSLNSKTRTTTISAFDFGSIPGVAYVNRFKNWQYAGMVGFGPVIQSKFYILNEATRGFLGLAPRYDIRFIAGYNVPKWFVMLTTEFDNRSVRFNDLRYRNYNYSVRLAAGIRLDKKKKEKGKQKEK